MPFPIQNLPVIQNYDCHACGNCCTDYVVPVSDEERQRIASQGWENDSELKGVKLFVRYGTWWRPKYRLNHSKGNRCVFLSEKGLCRIHEKFGLDAKPFACRLYPYILVPNGDHWRISLRFACPSATANKGRPLKVQTAELKERCREMENWDKRIVRGSVLSPPPPLQFLQTVPWEDVHLLVDSLLKIVEDKEDAFPRRMLRCLAFARFCRHARFRKITGTRLREFLDIARVAVNAEVPRDLARMPRPGWIGRVLFRSLISAYLRKDQGTRRGYADSNWVTLRLKFIGAIWRMVRGKGKIPPVQMGLPDKTFAEFEEPAGPLPPEAAEVLERYYAIKIESLQFCGPSYFDMPFWTGFEALAFTLPMILWLSRGYREMGQPQAICKAINIIDEHYGYNPQLGQPQHRLGGRILASRQELDRLIAWYGR